MGTGTRDSQHKGRWRMLSVKVRVLGTSVGTPPPPPSFLGRGNVMAFISL